ncbi:hypothetical protein ACFL1X_00235 [Candidatus Hydrogenedentota bacterium]
MARTEQTRLCPFCREEIPALAVKCKYCGEMVSATLKPDERKLSIDDLGGEKKVEVKNIFSKDLMGAYSNLVELDAEEAQKDYESRMKSRARRKRFVKIAVAVAVVIGIYMSPIDFSGVLGKFSPPKSPDAQETIYLNKAKERLNEQDYVEALKFIEKAKAANPEGTEARGFYDTTAKTMIEKRIEKFNHDGEAFGDEFAQATALCNATLKLDPGNKKVEKLKAFSKKNKKRYELKVMDFEAENAMAYLSTSQATSIPVRAGKKFEGFMVVKVDVANKEVVLQDTTFPGGKQFSVSRHSKLNETKPPASSGGPSISGQPTPPPRPSRGGPRL